MSPLEQNLFEEVIELAEGYLQGTLDAQQLARLEELLATEPDAAHAMLTYMRQAGMLRSVFGEQRQFAAKVGEAKRDDYLKLLKSLNPTQDVPSVHVELEPADRRMAVMRWAPAAMGIAAVILLAVTIALVFSGTPSPDPRVATAPDRLDQPAVATAVATLTAERDAVWGGAGPASLAAGATLHAGQRLTLTAGIAELTTKRGAVAVIEAPATVELIDHNALHLHAGKLVGICETDSSKGFIVRTPALDVVDLGTRFGVDASALATEVHVYQGEVQVTRPTPGASGQRETKRLIQDQAIRAQADEAGMVAIQNRYQQFAAGVGIYRLAGTGATIHRGAKTDSEWRLIAVNDQELNPAPAMSLGTPRGSSSLTPNIPGIARWLNIEDPDRYQGDQDAVYTIQTAFVVPKQIDLDSAVLYMDFHADDRLEGLNFNGRPYPGWQQVTQTKAGKGSAAIPLNKLLVHHGRNMVHLRVRNVAKTAMHLYIAWEIRQDTGP